MYEELSDIVQQYDTFSGEVEASGVRDCLRDYSRRSLTYDSDKLPAFSGLCQRLYHVVGGNYLAGLWSRDLLRGLLWYSLEGPIRHAQPYRAPSWSWASVNGKLVYDEKELIPDDLDMKVIEYSVELKDESNRYGEVMSGRLVVEGRTTGLIRSQQAYEVGGHRGIREVIFDHEENDGEVPWARIFPLDDGARTGRKRSSRMEVGFLRDHTSDFDTSLLSKQEYCALLVHIGKRVDRGLEELAYGLVLRPKMLGPQNLFERVGLFRIVDPRTRLSWFRKWRHDTLTLV